MREVIKEQFEKFSDACDEAAVLEEAGFKDVRVRTLHKTTQIIDSITLEEIYYSAKKYYEVIATRPTE